MRTRLSSAPKPRLVVLLAAAALVIGHGCTSFGPVMPGVTLFGFSWNTSIRSPFGLPGTKGKPHKFQEKVPAYGSFGPVKNTASLDKYYFDFKSKWLHIVNDTVDTSDPADNLSKIWMSFIDPGAKSSGYHEVVVNFRCGIRDKLSLSPNTYAAGTCQLEMVDDPGTKVDRFKLTVQTTKSSSDDYIIEATGGVGKGTVYFRP